MMIPAKWSQKWLRTTANLALFAILAVWASPALAWHCCCAPEPAAPTHHVASTHSCCSDEGDIQAISAIDDCHCLAPQSIVAAPPESPFQPHFVSLDFVGASYSVVLSAPQTGIAVGFNADGTKLRSRSLPSSRGRAPPTFWL